MSFALDLHVDDGYMTGPAEKIMKGFCLSRGKMVLKLSPIIGVGNSFEHVGALRVIDEEGMWVKELDKYASSVLTMMRMKDCRPSTSSKFEKQTEPGDDDPCEQPELYRSAVCSILFLTERKPDLQATARWLCKRLDPNQKSWRQLVKTVSYIKSWQLSCREQASRTESRLTSMVTGLAMALTGNLHLEGI